MQMVKAIPSDTREPMMDERTIGDQATMEGRWNPIANAKPASKVRSWLFLKNSLTLRCDSKSRRWTWVLAADSPAARRVNRLGYSMIRGNLRAFPWIKAARKRDEASLLCA